MKTVEITLTANPDTQGEGGSCWLAMTSREGEAEMFAHGGSPLGPRAETNPDAWMEWAKRQLRSECGRSWRFDWKNAKVVPAGWSQGAGHAPNGVKVSGVIARKR